MADFFTQSAQLVPYTKRPRGATGFVAVLADEPAANDPAYGLGNFYAVIEVVSGGREAEEAVRITVETARETYFAEEGPQNLLDRFELATKAVNRALTDYVNRGNAGWVGKMSGVLGVLEGQNLHIAYTGSAEAFLYRGPHATRITVQPHHRIQQPSKIFGSIASGQLEIADKLLLATPALVHHLALGSLKTTVSENSPAGAVDKITQQLGGQAGDRIAALVLEFTTPELAAAQVMPTPEAGFATMARGGLLEEARSAAAPLLGETAGQTAKLAERAQTALRQLLPRLRQAGWGAAGALRPVLQSPKGRAAAGLLVIVIVAAAALSATSHSRTDTGTAAASQISQLVSAANTDQQRVIDQDASVRPELIQLKAKLKQLNTKANQKLWKAVGADPSTLAAQIQSYIDQLDHVVIVQPTKLADLSKAGHPALIAVTGGLAITIDPSTGQLTATDLHSGQVHQSANRVNGAVAIASASSGSGVFILTSQPTVYLYQPSSDSISQVSGGWENGSGLAAYAGNLYELTAAGVTKRVPVATGFSAASVSLPASSPGVAQATSLAIDGAIYLGSPQGIVRYVAGSLTGRIGIPSGLEAISSLSPGNGDYLLVTDAKAGRLALINSGGSVLGVSAEYKVAGLKAAALDVNGGRIYAISGHDLLSFTLPR